MAAVPMRSNISNSVDLAGGHRLEVVDEAENRQTLRLLDSTEEVTVTIEITEKGPVLKLHGVSLDVQAESLQLSGRSEVRIASGGDLSFEAVGDINSTARVQNVRSTHGNCNVRANDDIKLNGERVLVNC